jgi:hypothetical protein
MGRGDEVARSAALVVAHPGHEVLVHGWLERVRPTVHVLTDGSGRHGGQPRLARTARVLADAGAASGSLYGALPDAVVYDALLGGDLEVFVALAQQLAKELASARVECVVADAAEGFNPTHDVCRLLVNTACALAAAELGRPIARYEFSEFGAPDPADAPPDAIWLELDAPAFARKAAVAAAYGELAHEIATLRRLYGDEAFRRECLRPNRDAPGHYAPAGQPPVYERFGEALAARGQLARVIRCERHLRPLARALGRCAGVPT